jgi:hypothetical protein
MLAELARISELLLKPGKEKGDIFYVHSARLAVVGDDVVCVEYVPSDDGESLDVRFVDGQWGGE